MKNIVIVGGVAGGASCAARARRLSETDRIVMFERGPHVSFANCGLPYYVGDIIEKQQSLLVATPQLFRERFRIDVRVKQEVLSIDCAAKSVLVRERETGREYREAYDALVLSPGAAPIRPSLPGLDMPGVFTLRNIPDSEAIRQWVAQKKARRAVIVGGGFIGLEMAEGLAHRGLAVTILEMQRQILPPFDAEMTVALEEHVTAKGVTLRLGEALAGVQENPSGGLRVITQKGEAIPADMVLLALGVRPESRLAKDSGLALGAYGGIAVDERMQTSDPSIWAVGDAVEIYNAVTNEKFLLALAGPANRQGRIAADNIQGRTSVFRPAQATAICKAFDLSAAMTGASEKLLQKAGMPYQKAYLHGWQHAQYYPGACPLEMKLLFAPGGGRILGAQAIGREGADKRIDIISMAMQKQATVFDLEEGEFCYAPQFGSAKDPVNMLGMIAANALRGDAPLAQWEQVDWGKDFLLDVRDREEFSQGHAGAAVNIPLADLRPEAGALPNDRCILVYCAGGQRAHYATRTLRLKGLDARNLSGGIKTYEGLRKKALSA